MSWSNGFIGLPHAELGRSRLGVDCWGLAQLAFAEVAGIELPSYADAYACWQEKAEINSLIIAAKGSPFWRSIDAEEVAQGLDLVVLRRGTFDAHVGVVVRPGLMLHVLEQRPTCLERFDSGMWASRVTGVWRHHRMEGRVL